jgi:hypothetical protein
LPFKYLPIIPCKLAFTITFTIHEFSRIDTISVFFTTFYLHVLIIFTFEYFLLRYRDPFSMFLLVNDLPEVYLPISRYNMKTGFFYKLLDIKLLVHRFIVEQIIFEFLFFWYFEESIR